MSKSNWISLVLILAATALGGRAAFAQDKPKDEELDKFLKKLDGTKSPDDAAKPARREMQGGKGSSAEKAKPGEGPTKGDKDVAPKDKELDNFLEKLGETRETPAADDRPRGLPAPDSTPPNQPGKPKRNELKGDNKNLDEHLEELTGRKRKRKNPNEDEGSGPLGKIVKEMREVEQRLGKPDTGEETRKKQAEIVKKLDKVIDELKNMSSSQARRKMQLAIRQRQQQGQQQPGDQPGNTGGNAPYTKPEKPPNRRSTAMGKEEWGHLPPELRQEMENIFKEEGLTKRQPLIERYFDSLSKKVLVRGE